MYQSVLFDMDGLLLDTEPHWVQVMQEVFASVDVVLSPEECAQTTGLRFDQVVDYWYARRPWQKKSPQEVIQLVIDQMEEYIRHNAPVKEGAAACIDFFRTKGYKTAIASSSAHRLIQACVSRFPAGSFDITHSAEFEEYGKPHPAVFLQTARLLQTNPQHCVVLEDSFNGILAAKSARMCCVAVPEPIHFDKLHFHICDYKVSSLLDVPRLGVF